MRVRRTGAGHGYYGSYGFARAWCRVAVAARTFSEEQLEQLRSFPDIGRDDLIRYFTLTQADMAFVDPGRGRGR